MQEDTLSITIHAPQGVIWQGNGLCVSSENSEGPFDVLPDHARFMTILESAPIHIELSDNSRQEFTFKHAVLFFHDNLVKIYTHEN